MATKFGDTEITIGRTAAGEWIGRPGEVEEWYPLPFTRWAEIGYVEEFYRKMGMERIIVVLGPVAV